MYPSKLSRSKTIPFQFSRLISSIVDWESLIAVTIEPPVICNPPSIAVPYFSDFKLTILDEIVVFFASIPLLVYAILTVEFNYH